MKQRKKPITKARERGQLPKKYLYNLEDFSPEEIKHLPRLMKYFDEMLTLRYADLPFSRNMSIQDYFLESDINIADNSAIKKIDDTIRKALFGGEPFEIYISDKVGNQRLYFKTGNIDAGPFNGKRQIIVAFKSSEAEDNEELLHLLQKKSRES
jgi:hypothetical protein